MDKEKPSEGYVVRITPISDSEQRVYKCDLDPETKTSLHVYLYKNVKNVDQIKKNVINGTWKCALIKPSLILDPVQIAAAANSAALSEKQGTLTTRSVFTEILYNLSVTKNISQSLSRFGIDKDTEMFVCFLITPEKDDSEEILNQIQGQACTMKSLLDMRNLGRIAHEYKANVLECDIGLAGLLDLIISRMAVKNIISF